MQVTRMTGHYLEIYLSGEHKGVVMVKLSKYPFQKRQEVIDFNTARPTSHWVLSVTVRDDEKPYEDLGYQKFSLDTPFLRKLKNLLRKVPKISSFDCRVSSVFDYAMDQILPSIAPRFCELIFIEPSENKADFIVECNKNQLLRSVRLKGAWPARVSTICCEMLQSWQVFDVCFPENSDPLEAFAAVQQRIQETDNSASNNRVNKIQGPVSWTMQSEATKAYWPVDVSFAKAINSDEVKEVRLFDDAKSKCVSIFESFHGQGVIIRIASRYSPWWKRYRKHCREEFEGELLMCSIFEAL